MALNSRGRYAHYPQLRRWSRFCHLNAAVNHLRRGSPWGATFPPQNTITGRCAGTYQRKRRAVLSWSDLQDVKESMYGVAGGNGEESHDRSPVKRIQDWWTIIKCWTNGYQSPRDSFPTGWAHSQFAKEQGLRPHTGHCHILSEHLSQLSPAQSPSFCAYFAAPHTSICSLCHLTTGVGKKELTRSHVHKRTNSVLQAKVKRWSIQGERFSSEMLELRNGPDFGRCYFEISTQTYWLNISI